MKVGCWHLCWCWVWGWRQATMNTTPCLAGDTGAGAEVAAVTEGPGPARAEQQFSQTPHRSLTAVTRHQQHSHNNNNCYTHHQWHQRRRGEEEEERPSKVRNHLCHSLDKLCILDMIVLKLRERLGQGQVTFKLYLSLPGAYVHQIICLPSYLQVKVI